MEPRGRGRGRGRGFKQSDLTKAKIRGSIVASALCPSRVVAATRSLSEDPAGRTGPAPMLCGDDAFAQQRSRSNRSHALDIGRGVLSHVRAQANTETSPGTQH